MYQPLEDKCYENAGCFECRGEFSTSVNMAKIFNLFDVYCDVQEQTWPAAHELGHVWKVDSKESVGWDNMDSEDLVNRFAGKLLLPKDIHVRRAGRKSRRNTFTLHGKKNGLQTFYVR